MELSAEHERIGRAIVNAAYKVHKSLGPGLLERIYEVCMEHELRLEGFEVKRQVALPIRYGDMVFDEGLVLDLLVNDLVIVELKAVDTINPVWQAQLISHLRLSGRELGYLINFNVVLIKEGIKRFRI